MTDRPLSTPIGSLADGAERLERVARAVKEQQLTQNTPVLTPITNPFAISPDEAWSRRYMTAGIGPAEFQWPELPGMPQLPPQAGQVFAARPAPAPAATAKPQSAGDVRPGPIGAVLAKPAKKRGWFGRLVRGS